MRAAEPKKNLAEFLVVGNSTSMDFTTRIERKAFLTWALGSASAAALGCSSAPADAPAPGGAGAGGSAGTGGAGNGFSGTSSTAGTFATGGAAAGGAGAGGVAGSAGSGGGAAPAPDCAAQLKVFITADHGHVMNVTLADVMAGVTKVYDTMGTATHTHFIQLLPADFAKLQAGGTVRKLSCNAGHEHEYIVNCIGQDKPETTSGIPSFCDTAHTCADAIGNVCPELP